MYYTVRESIVSDSSVGTNVNEPVQSFDSEQFPLAVAFFSQRLNVRERGHQSRPEFQFVRIEPMVDSSPEAFLDDHVILMSAWCDTLVGSSWWLELHVHFGADESPSPVI